MGLRFRAQVGESVLDESVVKSGAASGRRGEGWIQGVSKGVRRNAVFKNVLFATLALEFGLGLQNGIFNNFVVEVVGITPRGLGLVLGIKEIPGLLTAPFTLVSRFLSENFYAGLCLVTAAMGLFLHMGAFGLPALLMATFTLSLGFHLFYPLQSSMVMKCSSVNERAAKIGQIKGVAAASSLGAFAVVLVLANTEMAVSYNYIHLAAGISALFGGLVMLSKGTTREREEPAKQMAFNAQYLSYYVLTFLEGIRADVSVVFAGYLLVEAYKTPVSTMMLLSALSSLIATFTRPIIGQIIDKWGERKSLIFNYSVAAALFCFYAVIKVPAVLYLIYLLDTGFWGFDAALTTYLGKIAPEEALSVECAVGSTIHHISGIAVPLVGGFAWDTLGFPVVFIGGALSALVSLYYSRALSF